MSIQFGDILRHNNPNYPIADVSDIRGGLRSIATFSGDSLISEYTSGDGGSIIPEKYKSGYSLLLETSTGTIYYYSGIDPTNVNHWTSIGIGGNGVTNTIPKWISPSKLGNSSITDNGDTVVISSNLQVVGTTSTINSENLIVRDPIILLAGSQSGVPTYDAGLFVNRGSSDTQAFIWDESEKEFKFITTTSGATVSGDVSIGTYSSVRTGVLSVGTGSRVNSRFIVSSSGGTVSLVVDEFGNVYNNGNGGIATNTAFGASALSITSGYNNTAIGVNTLLSNTSGIRNTAIGSDALRLNITGSDNTALGAFALYNHIGSFDRNTAIGSNTLYNNTGGYSNTAIGAFVLYSNITGFSNTAVGDSSLFSNTFGQSNTAIGDLSLNQNTTGSENIALGKQSLYYNTTGNRNTAIGKDSLVSNRTGFDNVAIGKDSLRSNTTGGSNIALGYQSLYNNTSGVILASSWLGGTGYVDGIYSNVTLVYATGSSFTTAPIVNIEVISGEVSSVTQISYGTGFKDTTTIFTINSYGTYSVGSGFEIGVIVLLSGSSNLAIGNSSLLENTTGNSNLAIGNYSLYSNTTGYYNTAIGQQSLYYNTTGGSNIALGYSSLQFNTSGNGNVALGYSSLWQNTTGDYNVALGYSSLSSNKIGSYNIALGYRSLYSSTQSNYNLAIGADSLYSNQSGFYNIAFGDSSLYNNTTGIFNTAIGLQALNLNTTGYTNIALGYSSLYSNTTGWGSIALGESSLRFNTTGDRNNALGYSSLRYYRGLWSTALGAHSLNNASEAINTLTATFSPGNSYTPGTYSNVRLNWTSGTFWQAPTAQPNEYPTAEIVVGPGGTVSSVTLKQRGVLISDNTTRFTAQTGTQSYHLGTASGSGFSIGIATIATASLNNALGHGALGNLGVGQNNIAIGMWAGSSYGIPGSNALTGSDQSIFIGRFASALNNDSVNEIVIGNEAMGNGSNTVTLGNDSIVKTILKGNIGIGTTSPSTKLHIYSTTSGAFRLEDGTQSYPGYVLTSDANGVGTWQGNTQVTITSATATALPSWNNTTVMSNFSATCSITIPDTGLPPNFSFRFIVISSNSSATIAFTYSSPVSILPNTLLTFAQYESGVIDRYGATQNYYITY